MSLTCNNLAFKGCEKETVNIESIKANHIDDTGLAYLRVHVGKESDMKINKSQLEIKYKIQLTLIYN